MKQFGMGMRLAALSLAMTIGAGAAVAEDKEIVVEDKVEQKVYDKVYDKVDTIDASFTGAEMTKTGTVVTRQLVDGIEYSFEWDVPSDWIEPETGSIAKGWLGTLIDIAIDLLKDDKGGGGGGNTGGGTTNTCTVNVTGAQTVVIGNLNCGGTQGTGNGSGSSGGTRPQ